MTNHKWPNNTLINRPVWEECLNNVHDVKFSACLSQDSELIRNNITHVSRNVTHFKKSAICMRQNEIKMFGTSSRDNRADIYSWNFKLNITDLMEVCNIL